MASKLHDYQTFDPHDWPFFWMTQAVGRYLQKLERALKQEGLDVSRWRALMCVGGGKLGVSEIADMAIVKLPTMLKIIQRMEAEGLVICEARENDGRFTDVSLTDRGQEARLRAWQIANALYDRAFRDVAHERQFELNATLREVFAKLGD